MHDSGRRITGKARLDFGRVYYFSRDVRHDHWPVGCDRGDRLREHSRAWEESLRGTEDFAGDDHRVDFRGVDSSYSSIDSISAFWQRIIKDREQDMLIWTY